ncbi:MAG: hypothetical protein R6U64_08585 [Bacteroidales bacterium]
MKNKVFNHLQGMNWINEIGFADTTNPAGAMLVHQAERERQGQLPFNIPRSGSRLAQLPDDLSQQVNTGCGFSGIYSEALFIGLHAVCGG